MEARPAETRGPRGSRRRVRIKLSVAAGSSQVPATAVPEEVSKQALATEAHREDGNRQGLATGVLAAAVAQVAEPDRTAAEAVTVLAIGAFPAAAEDLAVPAHSVAEAPVVAKHGAAVHVAHPAWEDRVVVAADVGDRNPC